MPDFMQLILESNIIVSNSCRTMASFMEKMLICAVVEFDFNWKLITSGATCFPIN